MSVNFNLPPGAKVIDLGGGGNRHPQATCCVDVRQTEGVDFVANFEEPLPIQSDEWDVVFSQYVIEHLSWRKVRQFVSEMARICKPGGSVLIITADTLAQIRFIEKNLDGWDGQPAFESFSCVLFGDQNYEENSHKNFMSPGLIAGLLEDAGFTNTQINPYGARETDLFCVAQKPSEGNTRLAANVQRIELDPVPTIVNKSQLEDQPPETLFDFHYFGGGGKVGGYAHEGLRDFPCHFVTAQKILDRKPESVLELGCARGYVLKKIQDAGIPGFGMEVSKHCEMTRVCDHVRQWNLCETPWPIGHHTDRYDLCFSIAVLEHVPEKYLSSVIKEMERTCKRGLHGIDFGEKDDGFDKTHFTLRPKSWWEQTFQRHAPGWPVEIVDKEELERGPMPDAVMKGDGQIKLNVGSHMQMFLYGWTNIDIADLGGWATPQGYKFHRHDVRNGLPYGTGTVKYIHSSHFIEHLTYDEGLRFLRECRRVIKPDGVIRFQYPDADLLTNECYRGDTYQFDEINEGCAKAKTRQAKLWELLHSGHQSAYDEETMYETLKEAGFIPREAAFRKGTKQLLVECLDGLPCLSGFTEAIPLIA